MKKTVRSILTVLVLLATLTSVLALGVCAADAPTYAREYEDSLGQAIVSVETSVEAFPSNTHTFDVANVSHAYSGFTLNDGEYRKVLLAYDVSMAEDNGGNLIDMAGSDDEFKLKIRIPKSIKDQNLELYRMTSATEGKSLVSAIENGYIYCSTKDFGVYAIAVKADPPVPYVAPDYTWLKVLIIVVVALAVIALVWLLLARVFGKKKGNTADVPAPAAADAGTPEAEVKIAEPAEQPEVTAEPAEQVTAEQPEATAEPAEEVATEQPEVAAEPPAPAEPPKPVILLNFVDESEPADAAAAATAVSVRFRTSFESRYIQSGALQDYYTVIKNALLSYKGIKSRTSWNYESFNKGRVQCAKINIKGNALLVYLALGPAEYNVKKYHFTDMSEKPKFEALPMLMKVKSDRSLKYTLELIAQMMKVLEIPEGEAANVDYHLPYETTEQLAARGLVKVIAPAGTTLKDNATVKKTNVGALLSAETAE